MPKPKPKTKTKTKTKTKKNPVRIGKPLKFPSRDLQIGTVVLAYDRGRGSSAYYPALIAKPIGSNGAPHKWRFVWLGTDEWSLNGASKKEKHSFKRLSEGVRVASGYESSLRFALKLQTLPLKKRESIAKRLWRMKENNQTSLSQAEIKAEMAKAKDEEQEDEEQEDIDPIPVGEDLVQQNQQDFQGLPNLVDDSNYDMGDEEPIEPKPHHRYSTRKNKLKRGQSAKGVADMEPKLKRVAKKRNGAASSASAVVPSRKAPTDVAPIADAAVNVNHVADEPDVEPAAELIDEQVAERVDEPVAEQEAEPEAEPEVEPEAEPELEPVAVPVAEPEADPIVEAVAELLDVVDEEDEEDEEDEVVQPPPPPQNLGMFAKIRAFIPSFF